MRIGATLPWSGLIVVLVALVTGCGAGQQAATAHQVATGGAGGAAGEIAVRDAQITYSGPIPGGEVYLPGEDAPLQATIVNTGAQADRLVAVSSPVAATVEVDGATEMPGNQVLVAGYDDPVEAITLPYAEEVSITLRGITEPLRAGLTYPVTFDFERGGQLTLELAIEMPDELPPRAEVPIR